MTEREALKIMIVFRKFAHTGDRELIRGYSAKQIKTATMFAQPEDKKEKWYAAMEERVDQLVELGNQELDLKAAKERGFEGKMVGLLIGFALGTLNGLLIAWLLGRVFN